MNTYVTLQNVEVHGGEYLCKALYHHTLLCRRFCTNLFTTNFSVKQEITLLKEILSDVYLLSSYKPLADL